MVENSSYLFVYGTLLDEANPFGSFLKANSRFYQKGWFKGALFNIGNYPGAIADGEAGGFVHGSIFLINDAENTLKELDNYEGFGDDFAQPNEFIRELVIVEIENAWMVCWVYLYNFPINDLPIIVSGKYQ